MQELYRLVPQPAFIKVNKALNFLAPQESIAIFVGFMWESLQSPKSNKNDELHRLLEVFLSVVDIGAHTKKEPGYQFQFGGLKV